MNKIPLSNLIKLDCGEYITIEEIPKYRSIKNKKRLAEKKRKKLYEQKKIKLQKKNLINRLKYFEEKKLKEKAYKVPSKTFKLKSYKDLLKLEKDKEIIILKFIYNSGIRKDIKQFQNYCKFLYRVNREEEPVLYESVLHKEEVEEVLAYFNDRKIIKNKEEF